MKVIGYLLITIGFLVATVAATSDEEAVYWNYFVAGLVVGIVGVVVVRLALRHQVHGGGRLTANVQTITATMGRIVENVTKLDTGKHEIDTYDVRHRIDELLSEDLAAFADDRESVAHAYGLPAYAEVMTTFAAGERYLNRVWSASADGYIDEVNEYLERAKDQFAETLATLGRLQQSAASGQLA